MMNRVATLFALALALSFTMAIVAAPVPQPSEKERIAKHWGKTEGTGEFQAEGKQLTLRTTVGKPFHSYTWNDKVEIPRTARTISGDFEITVRILDAASPNPDAKHDGGSAETNAGIYIMGDGMSLRYHLHQAYHRFAGAQAKNKMQRWLGIQANYPRGSASGSIKAAEDGKLTYLRLIRKDKAVTMSYSFDGEKWSTPTNPFRNIDMSIPDEITVGVFLSHTTYQSAHATFDGFTITTK